MHKLFWGFFAVCAVAAFMTGSPENADDSVAGVSAAAPRHPDMGTLALAEQPDSGGWYGGDITLERRDDGHFYASPRIGGARIEVLIDTGASFVALTGEDARAAGLSWNDADLQPVARGASGMVEGVPVMIDRIELDGTEVRDIPAAIIPEGLHVTLLGQSFLQRFDRVEIQGDSMVIAKD